MGRDFLPRGSGIVTRRPLVLQLNNIPATGESSSKGDVNQGGAYIAHETAPITLDSLLSRTALRD